jgi:PhoPQ-activated pathogenicity-related protein
VSEFNKIRKITFGPLSTPEFDSKTTIKMYPNPAHDEVTVEIHDLTEAYLELFNLNGQLLKKQMLTNDTKINIAELTKGVYIFKVTANEGTAVQKVIKY